MLHHQEPGSAPDDSTTALSVLLLVAAAAGVLVGFIGGAFRWCLEWLYAALPHLLTWLHDPSHTGGVPGWLWTAAIAALSVAFARALVRLAPTAGGSGIQHVEAVMHGEADPAPLRTLPVKFLGGLFAIGPGLALGREGPTVQMAAIIGTQCGRLCRLNRDDRFMLYTAVAGAGLSVAFNAPLAGAVFVIEEVARRVTLRRLLVTLTAVGTSVAVFRAHFGNETDFTVTLTQTLTWENTLAMTLLGALCGLLGVAYNHTIIGGLKLFSRAPAIPSELKAAAVGALIGLLGWWHPEWIGSGEHHVQTIFNGQFAVETLLVLLAVRWILGSLSYAPGVPGGLFAPLLLVGTILGTALALILKHLAGWPLDTTAFAMVGMAAFFAGVIRAPFTGILLVVEMTGNVTLMVPLLLASVVAVAIATALGNPPIYDTLRARMIEARLRTEPPPV
mgnify:FL=1